ncbi:hypothetical protein M3Y94_00351900 [Aphelenchoides besseyi]|nr:hypothetical protein M3Y94_00351900 [Aphelenchoides besseyi]
MMDNQAVDSEGEQFASTNLLYLNNVASFNNNSDDPVTCFVGTSKYLICGTEKGKIIRFQYNDGKLVYHDSLPLGFAISQLIPLEDCNFLLVISNKSLVYIELDSLKPLGTTGDGLFEFASLVNPTNNDPNNIQLVLATNRRAIFRCRLSITVDSVNVDVLEKIETTDTIRCVCANERGVCYATSSHYYVFNFDDTDTHHQLIGLEDRAPHIRSVAKDEFFISAPHGLNVFVSSNGSSNRQPIFAEFDVSDVCISNSILYLLGDQMISIVDIDDEDIQFELKDENLKFICKACDRFFLFTSDKKVHELKLAKEFEKNGFFFASIQLS